MVIGSCRVTKGNIFVYQVGFELAPELILGPGVLPNILVWEKQIYEIKHWTVGGFRN